MHWMVVLLCWGFAHLVAAACGFRKSESQAERDIIRKRWYKSNGEK